MIHLSNFMRQMQRTSHPSWNVLKPAYFCRTLVYYNTFTLTRLNPDPRCKSKRDRHCIDSEIHWIGWIETFNSWYTLRVVKMIFVDVHQERTKSQVHISFSNLLVPFFLVAWFILVRDNSDNKTEQLTWHIGVRDMTHMYEMPDSGIPKSNWGLSVFLYDITHLYTVT